MIRFAGDSWREIRNKLCKGYIRTLARSSSKCIRHAWGSGI